MINGKKLVVVLPAFNAGNTLEMTYLEMPFNVVDEVILVDDGSTDDTIDIAQRLGIEHVVVHDQNRGYGGNQKSCYDKALELGGDVIVMVHPDYQYTPKLITSMAAAIAYDVWPVMFGSRILGKGALRGGMPKYKYVANRLLTLFQNLMIGQKLSEYHTGYRAFDAEVLRSIPYHDNSDDFVFDNEIISLIFLAGYEIGEITCPTKYFPNASSISLNRSVRYGLGVIRVSIRHMLARLTGQAPTSNR
jgi:glycosyltransferase involved in cell wall biosynthesis